MHEVLATFEDSHGPLWSVMGIADADAKAAKQKEVLAGFKVWLARLDKQVAANNGHFVGNSLTVADTMISAMFNMFNTGVYRTRGTMHKSTVVQGSLVCSRLARWTSSRT